MNHNQKYLLSRLRMYEDLLLEAPPASWEWARYNHILESINKDLNRTGLTNEQITNHLSL